MGSLGMQETRPVSMIFSGCLICPVCNLALAQKRLVEATADREPSEGKNHWMDGRMKSIQNN